MQLGRLGSCFLMTLMVGVPRTYSHCEAYFTLHLLEVCSFLTRLPEMAEISVEDRFGILQLCSRFARLLCIVR